MIFGRDSYIQSIFESQTLWVVTLSNGEDVYQDDCRYGIENNSWLRLKKELNSSNLYITSLRFVFRSHVESIDRDADGYFFIKGFMGSIIGNHRTSLYIGGTLLNNVVTVKTFQVPELLLIEEEIRTIEACEECLIKCPKYYTNQNSMEKK